MLVFDICYLQPFTNMLNYLRLSQGNHKIYIERGDGND